jgi:hypothetical protein
MHVQPACTSAQLFKSLFLLLFIVVSAGHAAFSLLTDKRDEEEDQAPESWRPDSYVVNGQVTSHNPWAASNQLGVDISRYREAQARLRAKREAEAAADGSGSSSRS